MARTSFRSIGRSISRAVSSVVRGTSPISAFRAPTPAPRPAPTPPPRTTVQRALSTIGSAVRNVAQGRSPISAFQTPVIQATRAGTSPIAQAIARGVQTVTQAARTAGVSGGLSFIGGLPQIGATVGRATSRIPLVGGGRAITSQTPIISPTAQRVAQRAIGAVRSVAQGTSPISAFQAPRLTTTSIQSVSPNLPNYAPQSQRQIESSPQTQERISAPTVEPKVSAPTTTTPTAEPTFEPVDQTVVQTAQTLANQGLTPDQIAENLNQQTGSEFAGTDIQGFLEGGQLAGAIPTESYLVQPGDNLGSIARRLGVAVGDISGYRSGNPGLIYPGENLTVSRGGPVKTNVSPASAPPASTLPEETALTTNETDYLTYLQEKTYGEIYKTLTEQLGLDDVKDNINDINDKLQKLQDDRAEEEADINNNPWISESLRAKKIQSLGGKYDQKEANLREAIKNSQDVYDDARQEAQFAAKMYIDQQNENREYYYKVKQDAEEMKLKREDATPDIQEYKFAQSQGFGGSFMDYQRQAANLKAKAAGGAGDGQTGIPSISQGDVTGDPFLQTLLQSSGGKRLTDTSVQKLDKAFGVLDQLGVLQNNIQNTKTGPITGLFRGKNPWDTNAQTIKAQLNAIVPNLARGVFGEVGVLTDNDIKQYSKTLPNLTSTEDVRNAVLGITVDMIGRSLKRTLQVNAANKADVSGYAELYNDMIKTRDSIFSTIGQVSTQPKKKRGIGGFVKDFFSELFTKGY